MSLAGAVRSDRIVIAPEIVLGLALAAGIAWLQPFDRIFAAVTLDQPALRAALIVALAVVGARFAREAGLIVIGEPRAGALLVPVLVAAAVAVFCALVDRAFEPLLHPDYLRAMTHMALPLRTAAYMMRAFNENIIYRLFLGSLFAWALGRVWRDGEGRPAAGALWSGFALSQAINIGANVTAWAPITSLALVHDGLRYLAPGMVWSWLYMRRGFQANEVASTTVHLFFQPLAGLMLAH